MIYESNKTKKKNGFEYKEQKFSIDTGDRVNDINIQDAVIHVLDSNSGEPILNEYTLELTEDTYKFLYKHIEKIFKNDDLVPAAFNQERNLVKEIISKKKMKHLQTLRLRKHLLMVQQIRSLILY